MQRMSSSKSSEAFVILAMGAAAGLALWGFAQVIPPLFQGIAFVIQAVVAAGGLAVGLAAGSAGAVSAWVVPVASAGVAATGAGVTLVVLHKIVENGKEKPYEWLLPALGLLAVFFVDISKDGLVDNGTMRALYALGTGICTIGGGVLLLNRHLLVRVIGFVLPFVPTAAVWATLLSRGGIRAGIADFVRSGSLGSIGLVGVLVMGVVIAVLGVLLPNQAQEKAQSPTHAR